MFVAPQDGADAQERYLAFIARLASAVSMLPNRSVPLFSERFSYEQSHARFQPKGALRRLWLHSSLANVGPLVRVVRALRALGHHRRLLARQFTLWARTMMIRARWRLQRPGSSVEAVFMAFGMKSQFLLAMKHRIEDASS